MVLFVTFSVVETGEEQRTVFSRSSSATGRSVLGLVEPKAFHILAYILERLLLLWFETPDALDMMLSVDWRLLSNQDAELPRRSMAGVLVLDLAASIERDATELCLEGLYDDCIEGRGEVNGVLEVSYSTSLSLASAKSFSSSRHRRSLSTYLSW